MEIDVQPGDTFAILEDGTTYQWRGGISRTLSHTTFGSYGRDSSCNDITLSDFRRIAELAGHTVTEVAPEQEAVVVTHMVEHKDFPHGACYFGTKAACENWANKNDVYVIRPVRFEVKQ